MDRKSREFLAVGVGCVLLFGFGLFGGPLRSRLASQAVLGNPMPPPELVEDFIERSPVPAVAIVEAWNTRKMVHRLAAVRQISRFFPLGKPLPADLELLVVTAALDVDMAVREVAIGILSERHHSVLAPLAVAQLQDPDPQVRLMGLNALKRVGGKIGAPSIIRMLDDGDPLIVATALKLLETWSGENFGVKLRDTASFENPATGLNEPPEGGREKARAGAARAKAWWTKHRSEFAEEAFPTVRNEIPAPSPLPAGDFTLQDLAGRSLRLSELRGKVVLINFWTTWCSACLSEIPTLIELQKRHGDRLAIIGVSLDFVPDSHGHIGGHAAVEEQGNGADENSHQHAAKALNAVKEKVRRTVEARGINYPVLLDEKNQVGGRFNGGELPTTIIIDSNGMVRRRFVGARGLSAFEAMIAEAGKPQPDSLNQPVAASR